MFGRRFDLERLGEARKPFFSSRLFGKHVTGACDWSRAHTLTQMPEFEMSKFDLAPHPLDSESRKRRLEPTPEFKQKQIEAQRAVLSRAGSNIFKEVLAKTEAKELIEKIGDKVDEDYIHDFRNWIAGIGKRSDYVKGGVPLSSVGHGKPLSRDPTVINFIDRLTGRVIDYYAEIANMKMRGPGVGRRGGPATLNDLWLYFKYVVRNDPIDPRDFAEAAKLAPDDALIGNEDGIIDSRSAAPSVKDNLFPAPANKRQRDENSLRAAKKDAQERKKAEPKAIAEHIAGTDGPETTLPVTEVPESAPPSSSPSSTDPVPDAVPPSKTGEDVFEEFYDEMNALDDEVSKSNAASEINLAMYEEAEWLAKEIGWDRKELKDLSEENARKYFKGVVDKIRSELEKQQGKGPAEPVVSAAPGSASMTREKDEPDTPIVRRTPAVIPPPGSAEHFPKEAPDTPITRHTPDVIPPPHEPRSRMRDVQGTEEQPKQKSPIPPPPTLSGKLPEVQGAEEPPRGKYPLQDEPSLDQRQTALLKASLQKISEDLLDAYESAKTPEEKARTNAQLNAALQEIAAIERAKKHGPDTPKRALGPLKSDDPMDVTVENQKTTTMGSLKWDMIGLRVKQKFEATKARLAAEKEEEDRVRAADEAAQKKRETDRQRAAEAAANAQKAAEALKKAQDEAAAKVKAAAEAREKEAAESGKKAARIAEWKELRKTRPNKETQPFDYVDWLIKNQSEPGHPGYSAEENQEAETARLARIAGIPNVVERWKAGEDDVALSSRAKKALLSWISGEGIGRFVPLEDHIRFDIVTLMVPKLKRLFDQVRMSGAPLNHFLEPEMRLLLQRWNNTLLAWPQEPDDEKQGVPFSREDALVISNLLQSRPGAAPASASAAPPPRPAAAAAPPPPEPEPPRRSKRNITPVEDQAGYPRGDFQSKSAQAFQEETAIMSQLAGQYFGARAKQTVKGGSEQQKQDYIYRASSEAQRIISRSRIPANERAKVYNAIRQWIYQQVYE